MKRFLSTVLLSTSFVCALGAVKLDPVPRSATGDYRTEGLFQAGTPGPKNIDALYNRDFGSAERWVIDFSEPGKPKSFSNIPELQVQYEGEEKVLSDSGELIVAREPKVILKFRSIRKNALDRDRFASLIRKSKHVKAITLYPAIEGGDTALEFLLKGNVPFRPSLEAGRLLLDLKEPARF